MIDTVLDFLIGQQCAARVEPLEDMIHASIVLGVKLLYYKSTEHCILQSPLIFFSKLIETPIVELTGLTDAL